MEKYELLDSGDGRKLERFGRVVLARPCSQAIWKPQFPASEWERATASFDRDKGLNVNKAGASEATGFLVVIPGGTQACEVGDKILEGEGPEVSTDAQWRELIPSKVPGLVVVKHVDAKPWGGGIAHTEARG